eukprot:TRINITY_DN9651_c0_g1_i10.p1 TRINITY_DN9651_c0_g1~~TRINITY_DN9651_c0_g1_i10.p1  ORF type:complete len:193 (+),score=5.06 TRINITY_DN9651_c0_g1_i10:840-1418(+)
MLNSSIGDLSSSLSTTLAGLTAQVAVTDLSLEQGVGELSMRLNSTRSTLLEQPVFSLMNFWRDGSLLYYIDCDKDRTQYILDAGDYTQEVRAGSGRHGFVYQPPTTGRGGRLIFSLANSVGIACILRSSEDDSPKPYHYRIATDGGNGYRGVWGETVATFILELSYTHCTDCDHPAVIDHYAAYKIECIRER